MKHLFLTITAMFRRFSCDNTAQKKNDLQKANLKGKVKSVREITYKAVEKFGEITKGEIINNIILSLYNKKGNLIEVNSYNSNGTLDFKKKITGGGWTNTLSSYNEKRILIKKYSHNSNGTLDFKGKYQYDNNGNKIEDDYYSIDGTLFKHKYKYDDKGNEIEKFSYTDEYIMSISKYQYKYDQQGNWIERIEYIMGIIEITERTIEYYD